MVLQSFHEKFDRVDCYHEKRDIVDTSTHAFLKNGHNGTKGTGFPIIWGAYSMEGSEMGSEQLWL